MEEDIRIHPMIYDVVQVVLEWDSRSIYGISNASYQIMLIVFMQLIILFGLPLTSFQLRLGNGLYEHIWL